MAGYHELELVRVPHPIKLTRAARTMEDMRAEMNRHRDGMTPMMSAIDMAMEGMASHCGGDGLDDMRAMHGNLDGEMALHGSAIDAITDPAAGVVETERHATTMMATMEGMDGAMQQMRCH